MRTTRVRTTLAATTVALAAVLAYAGPGRPGHRNGPRAAPGHDRVPHGFVRVCPDIDFVGRPCVERAVDGSERHLPDYIRRAGSSVINNNGRTAQVYQKDNYIGRHVCVGRDGGTINDPRSYQLNDITHSLKINDTPCGARPAHTGSPARRRPGPGRANKGIQHVGGRPGEASLHQDSVLGEVSTRQIVHPPHRLDRRPVLGIRHGPVPPSGCGVQAQATRPAEGTWRGHRSEAPYASMSL
ncbi:peptidase inhibitor family I36 protein [Kitasatospora sp. NPDC003701]